MVDWKILANKVLQILKQVHDLRKPKVVPSEGAVSKVVEEVFWASLDKYEGVPLRARMYFAPDVGEHSSIVRLASPQVFNRHALRLLAPAHTENAGLLVHEREGQLVIDSIMAVTPSARGGFPQWLCVQCREPGVVRVSIGDEQILEFNRGEIKQIGGYAFDRLTASCMLAMACKSTRSDVLPIQVPQMLLDIAIAIERQGSGGAIWILPKGGEMNEDLSGLGVRLKWNPASWEPFRERWEARTKNIELLNTKGSIDPKYLDWAQHVGQEWDIARMQAVARTIAGLSRVDGAIVMNCTPDVLAFGVIRNGFSSPCKSVLEPTDPRKPLDGGTRVNPDTFGGSRHRSAIDFCSSMAPAAAIVASHDGGLTVFAAPEREKVFGTRVSVFESDSSISTE